MPPSDGVDRLISEQSSPLTDFSADTEPILPARIDEAGLLAARTKALHDRRQPDPFGPLDVGAVTVRHIAPAPGDDPRHSA
jgi:hypothetical protein